MQFLILLYYVNIWDISKEYMLTDN